MNTRMILIAGSLASLVAVAIAQQQYRDPRSFEFKEAVKDTKSVTVSQPSTSGYVDHPRGTTDPLFIGQELLGRPTDKSVTVNVAALKNLDAYFEYGTKPGSYSGKTEVVKYTSGVPANVLIDNLKPDTRYYYRMRYKEAGAAAFTARAEHSFMTQRLPGSTFTYVVQFDPHLMEGNNMDAYKLTLKKMAADNPDFMIDLGDTAFVDRENPKSMGIEKFQAHLTSRNQLTRSYFDLINHSVPLYLVLGNHEGEWARNLDGTPNNIAVMHTLTRKKYYPNPEPNGFYTGSTRNEAYVGLRQSNYAWQWGDALFIALDPYWNQPVAPELAGDWWTTLGKEQYDWLKRTLENSKAKYKFVFSHNLIGGLDMKGLMRGGIETVKYLEMGGYNLDGTWGFDKARPGWAMPIHQLLVANNATIYFHGHDHLYVKQDLDGLVYQEGPVPARIGKYDATTAAKDYNYTHGTVVGGSGYLRVRVSPDDVKVDYVQTYLPSEEDATHKDGMIGDSYTIKTRKL